MRERDAAGAEDQLDLLVLPEGAKDGRGELVVLGRPDPLPVERDLVLLRLAGLKAVDDDQGEVVPFNAECLLATAEHLDLAGLVGLDPDGRVRGPDVTQQRS